MFTPKQPEKKYQNLKLCIAVSLGNNDFQGEKFEKLLKFASKFPKVEFQLGDGTLHAENLKIFYSDLSYDELVKKSNELGKKWWKNNLPVITKFLGIPIKKEPGHWNWAKTKNYQKDFEKFEHFLKTNPKHKIIEALKKTKEEVLPRFLKKLGLQEIDRLFNKNEAGQKAEEIVRGKKISLEEAEKLFIQKYSQEKVKKLNKKFGKNFVGRQIEKYLKQETFVIHYSDRWAKLGYNRIAYPNKITPILKCAAKEFSRKKYKNLLIWIPVRVTPKKKKMKVFTDENNIVNKQILYKQGILSPLSFHKTKHFNFNINSFKAQTIMQLYITLVNTFSMLPKEEHSSFIFSIFKTITNLCPERVQLNELNNGTSNKNKNIKFSIKPEEPNQRLIFQYN